MSDVRVTVGDAEASALEGETPTITRGESVELTLLFDDRVDFPLDEYDTITDHLAFTENAVRYGTTDTGVPWVRERLPARAPVSTQILDVQATGADLIDFPEFWGLVVGGEDTSTPYPDDTTRVVSVEMFVLASLDQYSTRDALYNDLGPGVV